MARPRKVETDSPVVLVEGVVCDGNEGFLKKGEPLPETDAEIVEDLRARGYVS